MNRAKEGLRQLVSLGRRRPVLLTGAVGLVVLLVATRLRHDSQSLYLTAAVQRGEIRDAVDATGTVNAVTTVQVGSQVSGRIAKLNADFNSRVHRGDVIALIDPSLFQGALQQATADLESAQASVAAAQADSERAYATFVQTKADYDRMAALGTSRSVTQQEEDLAKANYAGATASLHAAAAGVAQARAQVRQRSAALSVARINLDHTVIRAPIDGIVVARNVDVGQTVAASLQAPTIFTIAQDLTQMQVYAKVDESDVGRVRLGQTAAFKVDAFPKDTFLGVVGQVRLNATTVQNVVTYDVIVDFRNPALKLFPGMTAYVTMPVATREDVLKLPNAALRYTPALSPAQIQALYAKYGVEDRRETRALSLGGDTGTRHGHGGSAGGSRAQAGEAAAAAAPLETAIVWKLHADGAIEPVKLALGITDHAYTEVTALLHGVLQPGADVVIGSMTGRTAPRPGTGR